MKLKSFELKEKYVRLIEKAMFGYLWQGVYKPIFDVLKIKPAINSIDTLITALKENRIYYVKELQGFKSTSERFTNAQSLEFERLGAKYNKFQKIWKLPFDKIPSDLLVAMSENQMLNEQKIKFIQSYIGELQQNMPLIIDNMVFNKEVVKILDDAGNEIHKTVRHINIIEPELTEKQKQEIAQAYTNNIQQYMIKDFADEKIPKMRAMIQQAVLNGYRLDTVEDIIKKNFREVANKARFLAFQETNILMAEYKRVTYQAMGFEKFIWQTRADSRVRDLHKHLNGTVWRYDDPPVIDERTGQKGLPGETYNCYSKDTEVMTDTGFKLIKDVKVGEKIASVNPHTREWEWTECTNTVKKKVDVITNIETNIFDLSVSIDHTFFYYKKKYDGKKIIPDSEYPVFTTGVDNLSKKNTQFIASAKWYGKCKEITAGIPTDIFCKFIGYYLSDGNIDKRTNNCIHISQCNNDKMFKELEPYLHIRQGKEKLFIYNETLFNIVEPLGHAHDKYIPDIIKEMPADKIRIFLNAFASCDGTPQKENVKGFYNKKNLTQYNQYFTTSPQLMADLVECIYKTSMSCSVYTRKQAGQQIEFKNGDYKLNYDLYIINEMKTLNRRLETAKINTVPYNDFVYDIEVKKNHTILIKKGKSIHWNSNCRCVAIPYMEDSKFINAKHQEQNVYSLKASQQRLNQYLKDSKIT